MNRKKIWVSFSAILMLFPLSVTLADRVQETSLFELSLAELMNVRIVSAASGFEQNIDDAPASVTVIEAEEWQAIGATTLTEAIANVPGLHVGLIQLGLLYEKPIIRGLSGSFGQQVLLLMDGMPFRSPREGGAPWSQYLPLNSFKRIEIIRGSGSAIYGADAVGGIINLVSYKNGETPDTLALLMGDNNRRLIELSKSFEYGRNKFNFSWSTKSSDSSSSRIIGSDFQSLNDTYLGTSATLAPGALDSGYEVHTLRTTWSLDNFSASYLDWYAPEYGNGVGLSQALDPTGQVKMRTQFLELNYNLSTRVKGEMDVRFAWHKFHLRTKSTLFPSGAALFLDPDGNIQSPGSRNDLQFVTFLDGVKGNPGSDNRVFSLQLNHILNVTEAHKFRWALGLEYSDNYAVEEKNFGPGVYDGQATEIDGPLKSVTGTEFVYLPDAERKNHFIAIQDQWALSEHWDATLGVRYDNYSDFGTTTNPRLGLIWRTSEKISFKAYAGSAFRAPSFVDLYSQNNPAGVGNLKLKPESIDTIDVSFIAKDVFAPNLQLETSLFQYAAKDLITYVPQASAQMAENAGQLKVRGVEQQVNWRSSECFSVEWSVSLITPYKSKGIDMSSVPQRLSNLNFHFHKNSLHWFIGGKWVAKRERDSLDTRKPIDDYFTVNSRLQYHFEKWSMSIVADNLLNEDAREPSSVYIAEDYPLEGRNMGLQVMRNF